MKDITLGQIGNTILTFWRGTYPIWKLFLSMFAVVFLMCFWLFVTPTAVVREGRLVDMSQMTLAPWAFPVMIICFGYLFGFWLFRTVKDWLPGD